MEKIILILFFYFQLIGISIAELINAQEDYELDPKEAFFRHLRSYDVQQHPEYVGQEELPVPGGLQFTDFTNRNKRSYHVLTSPGLQSHFKINLSDDKSKYKRNKRSALNFKPVVSDSEEEPCTEEDINMTTEVPTTLSIKEAQDNNITPQDLIINDFIRFKRDSVSPEEDLAKPEADITGLNSRSKREPEIRTEKMVMERDFNEPGTDREPRGATKEQWIKQPYPVERPVDDNVPSASDSIRAPRVHFVTQRRPGQNNNQGVIQENRQPQTPPPPPGPPAPQPPPYHRMHDEREGRTRDFDPYSRPPPPPQSPYYPAYPRPRSYDPYRPRYYDPYFDRDRFDDRRYGFDGYDQRFDRDRNGRPMMPQLPLPPPPPPGNKQRRIIYYATLPEVVRTPSPNSADYRYRFRYQDGYDDRAPGMTSSGRLPPGPPGPADYRGGKPYTNQIQKHRDYDRANAERKKTPLYPVKVSTDVNVREPKKSPERRVYSEVDRRYNNYKPPSFQTAEEGSF